MKTKCFLDWEAQDPAAASGEVSLTGGNLAVQVVTW